MCCPETFKQGTHFTYCGFNKKLKFNLMELCQEIKEKEIKEKGIEKKGIEINGIWYGENDDILDLHLCEDIDTKEELYVPVFPKNVLKDLKDLDDEIE